MKNLILSLIVLIPSLALALPPTPPTEVYCGSETLVTLTRNFDSKGNLTESLSAWIQFKTNDGKVKLYRAVKSYDANNKVTVFTSKNKRYTVSQEYIRSKNFVSYQTKAILTDNKTGETATEYLLCNEV